MTLAVEIKGEGPDLVMLHGWGMHSAIWLGLLPFLTARFRLHLVDLPGHGESGLGGCISLEDWAEAVLAVTPTNASWVGWSLGGLVAMQAAQLKAQHIKQVLLLCSTPRFTRAADWPHAVACDVLQSFSEQFELDFPNTLKRFLALQVLGSRQSGKTLREIRHRLLEKKAPDRRALQAGLVILQTTDFRASMNTFPVPLYWLLAGRDTIVPPQAADQYPEIPQLIIQDAGHAPFISHPEQCTQSMEKLLNMNAHKSVTSSPLSHRDRG